MIDEEAKKIAFPKGRMSSTQISSLIGEAVPRPQKVSEPENEIRPQDNTPVFEASDNPVERPALKAAAAIPVQPTERLQILLSPTIIAETKIRALKDRTTASAIVEAALFAYLKL